MGSTQIKRRMLFNLFAMESAFVEKFLWRHTAIDYADMHPDANGELSSFCIDQLVDAIRSMQRCLDHEVILNAWSHNLALANHFIQRFANRVYGTSCITVCSIPRITGVQPRKS